MFSDTKSRNLTSSQRLNAVRSKLDKKGYCYCITVPPAFRGRRRQHVPIEKIKEGCWFLSPKDVLDEIRKAVSALKIRVSPKPTKPRILRFRRITGCKKSISTPSFVSFQLQLFLSSFQGFCVLFLLSFIFSKLFVKTNNFEKKTERTWYRRRYGGPLKSVTKRNEYFIQKRMKSSPK